MMVGMRVGKIVGMTVWMMVGIRVRKIVSLEDG